MNNLIKQHFNKYQNNNGFSLIELVVAIGILLVLTVGGLLSYNEIIKNARQTKRQQTVSEIYTLVVTQRNDSNMTFIEDTLEQWADEKGLEYVHASALEIGCMEKVYIVGSPNFETGRIEQYNLYITKDGLIGVYSNDVKDFNTGSWNSDNAGPTELSKLEPGFDIKCINT